MFCHFRHLKDIFAEAGIEATPDPRQRLDPAIHDTLGNRHKGCPSTSRKLKRGVIGDAQERRTLIEEMRKAYHGAP